MWTARVSRSRMLKDRQWSLLPITTRDYPRSGLPKGITVESVAGNTLQHAATRLRACITPRGRLG